MNGYERRKQKKIGQIFEASMQLFAKHGYRAAGVNEIARLANVSPATIYNYFGTKERLYADMLTSWIDSELEQYERILEGDLAFPAKLRAIMLREADNLKLLSDEFGNIPSSERTELTLQAKNEAERKLRPLFVKLLAKGKREGYIRSELKEETAMLYFTMYTNELGRHWSSPSGPDLVRRHIDQLLDLFLYGLVGQPHAENGS